MANFGYGGFLYSRGPYGVNTVQAGTVGSAWGSTSSLTASRRPTVQMPVETWRWSSTSADSAMQSGDLSSNWTSTDVIPGHAIVVALTASNGVLASIIDGQTAKAGATASTWSSADTAIGSLRPSGVVRDSGAWVSHLSGALVLDGDTTSAWSSTSQASGMRTAAGVMYEFLFNYSTSRGKITANAVEYSDWIVASIRIPSIRVFGKEHADWNSDSESSGRLLWENTPPPLDPDWITQTIGPDIWTPVHK